MMKRGVTLLTAAVMLFHILAVPCYAISNELLQHVVRIDTFDDYVASREPQIPAGKGWGGAHNDGMISISESVYGTGNSLRLSSQTGEPCFVNQTFGMIRDRAFVDIDVMFSGGNTQRMIELRTNNDKTVPFISTKADEKVLSVFGQDVLEFNNLISYRITVETDIIQKRYAVYIDGTEITRGQLDASLTGFCGLKMIQCAQGEFSSMYIDNIRVYKGTKIWEIDDTESYVQKLDEIEAEKLSTGVYLFARGDNAWVFGKQVKIDANPKVTPTASEDGSVAVPMEFMVKAFGGSFAVENRTVNAKIACVSFSAVIGNETATVNSEHILLSKPLSESEGTVMIEAQVFSNIFRKAFFYDDHGLIAFSNNQTPVLDAKKDEVLIEKLVKTVAYDRPGVDRIISDFAQNNTGAAHPRIWLDETGFEKIKYNVENDPDMKGWFATVKRDTDKLFEEPLVQYVISNNRRMGAARQALNRIIPMALIYRVTGEEKYRDRAIEEMMAMCSFPDWNHVRAEHLNVSESSCAMAIGYDWLYYELTEEQRKLCREKMTKYGLEPAKQFYDSNVWWTTSTGNWNSVMAGGFVTLAAALMDEEPYLSAYVTNKALKSVENILSNYYPDGSWHEGISYWQYAMSYLVNLWASLESVQGTIYGLFNMKGLVETTTMPLQWQGPVGVFNFHDAASGATAPELSYLASLTGNNGLMGVRRNQIAENRNAVYRDIIWYDPQFADINGVSVKLDEYYPGIETVFMHQNWEQNAIYTGLHSGTNLVGHSHYDAGQFIVDADGERWIIDTGKDSMSYNTAVYNVEKEMVYAIRAESHNVLVVNPSADPGQIQDCDCHITEYVSKPKGGYAITDLTKAYNGLKSYQRGLMLTNNREMVVVRDEIEASGASDLYMSFSTKADIELSEDKKTAILTQNNKKFWVSILSEKGEFEVNEAGPLPISPNPEGQIAHIGINKLVVWLKQTANANLTFAFAPLDANENSPENIPVELGELSLSKWKNVIPDGELVYPTLDRIEVGGAPLDGFRPQVRSYVITIPQDADVPEIKGFSGNNTVEDTVVSGKSTIQATIVVRDKTEKGLKSKYVVTFEREREGITLDTANKLDVLSVEVSQEPQAENPKQHMLDGNLQTRWSAQNEQYAVFELGEIYDINAINIAIYSGDSRKQLFDIEVSVDNKTWTNVFSGATSGETDGLEAIGFDSTAARYVKFVGHGADTSTWNSISEFEIYRSAENDVYDYEEMLKQEEEDETEGIE